MEERWQQFRSWVVAWLFFLSFSLCFCFFLCPFLEFGVWLEHLPDTEMMDVYGEQIKL
jgi:hypothetical protein